MNKQPSFFLSFVRARWLLVVVLVYSAVGLLLSAYAGINILPSCLWTAIFHRHCPGCGITTAITLLLQGHLAESWHTNPIAIPACIIILGAIIRDYFHFCRNFATKNKGA